MQKLLEHIEAKRINAVRHPTLPLTLYSYTDRCVYERAWDETTLMCRGLVTNDRGDIVARPFPKFFNDTEPEAQPIPWGERCEITEKLDGSLIIAFMFDDRWEFCTRGSWTSEQAAFAKDWLTPRLSGYLTIDTLLFEAIYPENRIVVDYGIRRECVLLGRMDTASGAEKNIGEWHRTPVVRSLGPDANPAELRAIIRDDEEGYVVRFFGGHRVKIKGARYMELHRLLSGVNARMVWEALSKEQWPPPCIEQFDEEVRAWIDAKADELTERIYDIHRRVFVAHRQVEGATRKEAAAILLAEHKDVASLVFLQMDGRCWKAKAWDMVYPPHERPTRAAKLNT